METGKRLALCQTTQQSAHHIGFCGQHQENDTYVMLYEYVAETFTMNRRCPRKLEPIGLPKGAETIKLLFKMKCILTHN